MNYYIISKDGFIAPNGNGNKLFGTYSRTELNDKIRHFQKTGLSITVQAIWIQTDMLGKNQLK
jgi:hypothetical protein|tara:strand:+ start:302 stop:490 length:189 start_codon:yes stop_codon:yes gene_type:complete